jgi:hypothetical protein
MSFQCGQKNLQFLYSFTKRFLSSTYAFTPTQVSTRFCDLTDCCLICTETVSKNIISHCKVIVSGGATLFNITVKSYCLALIVFPICRLRNLMCSRQFFLSRYERTLQPFLPGLYQLKWGNKYMTQFHFGGA